MTITTPAHHHPNSDDFADFPLRGPPRSSVIQLASKELDVKSPRFVPGAQAGLIALRFGRDEAKAASSFPFIPFASESEFGIYEPPVGTQRGARVDVVDVKPAEARWETNSNGKRECRLPNGYLVKESRILYMIVGAKVVSFRTHSSGLSPIFDLLDRCRRFSVKLPGETKPIRGPLVSKWKMGTLERREGSNRWWMPAPELLGKLGEPDGPTKGGIRPRQGGARKLPGRLGLVG